MLSEAAAIGTMAGAAAGGSAISSGIGYLAQKDQQRFNRIEAQKRRDWEERLANSAHQREVADLDAAGLNPILSVSGGGNGAATPSGYAAASSGANPIDDFGTSIAYGAKVGLQWSKDHTAQTIDDAIHLINQLQVPII